MKVFWSWQGDRIPKNHHYFVRDALQEACDQLAAEAEVDEGARPEVDHDTKDVAGTPDIVKAIAEKIDAAAAFVADMTPVAVTDPASLRPDLDVGKLPKAKHVQNANVMSELGYAEKAVGLDKIILVANAVHYPGPDALPFDWRNRRGPITYSLADDADNAARKAEQTALASKLREPLRLILGNSPDGSTLVVAPAADEADPALWAGAASGIELIEGQTGRDIRRIVVDDGPRLYVKVTPARWTPPTLSRLQEHMRRADAALYVSGTNGTSGKNGDGAISACDIWDDPRVGGIHAETVTQWFQQSGTFWAVDKTSFGFDERGHYFSCQLPFAHLALFLERSLAALATAGATGPFTIELGATQLKGASWPGELRSQRIPALKSAVRVTASKSEFSRADRHQILWRFWNQLRDAFGLDEARTFEQFEAGAAVSFSVEEDA